MGGATSKNIAKVTTEAISKVATNIIQNGTSQISQDQIININNINADGDIIISDITQKVSATINMKQLLTAMTSQEAQQDLSLQLAQQAKSLVSGINLGQFTNSSNYTETYMKAAIEITTTISQECAAKSSQTQVIEVSGIATKGDFTVKNINQEQVAGIFQSCIENAVSKSAAMQKLQQELDQKATSESKGFSIWAIVAMMVIGMFVILSPIILSAGGVMYALVKFMFPIIMIVGIILIALYFTKHKTVMDGYGYSKLLANLAPCGATPSLKQPDKKYKLVSDASDACKDDKDCKAVDWKGMNINKDGTATVLENPETTFYSQVKHNPCSNLVLSRDNLNILKIPKVIVSEKPPDDIENGDIWINSVTTKWKQWNNGSFSDTGLKNNPLVPNFDSTTNKIVFHSNKPGTSPDSNAQSKGDVVIKFSDINKPFFDIYTAQQNTSQWNKTSTSIPGYTPYVPKGDNEANVINSTAFKRTISSMPPITLWIGGALTGLGLFGTIYTFMLSPKTKKIKQKSKK